MARETVLEERRGGVAVLTFNRPQQKNAFNYRMWCDARDALAAAQDDDAVRAVVVTGAGNAFTAGQDLAEMGGQRPAGIDAAEFGNAFSRFMDRLCGFDKPLLAAVNGVGVGIGMTLLLHCDYVFIARGARLRAPFVTLGVVPEAAASYLLPAILGTRRAIDLLFESDFIEATRAVELGLATTLCEPADVLPAAVARAQQLAAKPLGSLRYTKRLVLATREAQVRDARARETEAFSRRVGSPENVEAVTAFLEKRPADFSNVSPDDHDGSPIW
jgi:enoyl-CoA hydratase/carnithine racemase